MRLNSIQVAGLKTEAACPTSEIAKDLKGIMQLAYYRGVQDGRTILARELVSAEADRTAPCPCGPNGPDCVAHERPGACKCGPCAQVRVGL